MAKLKFNPTPARQFLSALYKSFFSQNQGTAHLDVRGKQEGQGMSFRRFYRSPEDLLKDMTKWPPGLHFWIGVALRRSAKRGKKEDLLALTAAFGDVDCGPAGHKKTPQYQTKAEALTAVEAFPLRPSLVVDSGGGFQPYWLFRESVSLLEAAEIARVEAINRGLAAALGGDVAATDAARILRLPGTFNMKLAGKPRPVKIVWCELDRLYDLADFAQYEVRAQEHSQGARHDCHQGGSGAPAGDYEAYASKALAEELAKLAQAVEGERNITLNQVAFSLGQLVAAGVLDRGSVEADLQGAALSIGLGEAEARATIRSGLDSGEKEPRKLPERSRRRGNGRKPGGRSASPEKGQQGAQGEPEAEKLYYVGHTYFVEQGRLCLEVYDREGMPQTRPLANFQARIEEEISRDDSLKVTKEFHLTGSLDTGRPLPPALVPSEKFDSLRWIKPNWGAAAAVAPGRTLGPHLVNAIQAHSRGFKRRTVFAYTGWRLMGGVWRYLHGGGAIGQGEDLTVDLGETLGNYHLEAPGGLEAAREAARASLRFLEIAPWEVTAPLFACAYLAPFADLLKIDFSLWLFGPTGSMKSTLAALALCHFGRFDRLTLPGSWFSTVNSLEKLCFTLKDVLIVIDDFCPSTSAKESQYMAAKAGQLLYQVGNHSARGRLAPDLKAKPNQPPRGLVLVTGEMMLPGQRQSATARCLGVKLDPHKTPLNLDRLTAAQKDAHLYSGAMAAFLEDLAPRLEDVQEEIRDLWESYRKAFRGKAHLRVPEVQAWLMVGFEYAMNFFARLGAITQDQADQMSKRAWGVFEALGEVHSKRIEGERPTLKFLSILTELFLTSRVYAESKDQKGLPPPSKEVLGWEGSGPATNAFLVGYADDSMVYLLPETALRVVNDAIRAQGDFLSLGRNDLWAALAQERLIVPGRKRTSRVIKIQGGNRRVICLPLKNLTQGEGEEEAPLPFE